MRSPPAGASPTPSRYAPVDELDAWVIMLPLLPRPLTCMKAPDPSNASIDADVGTVVSRGGVKQRTMLCSRCCEEAEWFRS